MMAGMEHWKPTAEYSENDISPFFWPNGTLPDSEEYSRLKAGGFADYRLKIGGLVENPVEISLAELKGMTKRQQITHHYCIQGWSGIAKWGGVAMQDIMEIVRPKPEAKFAVFVSFSHGPDAGSGRFYDVHKVRSMYHPQTILAYEMNGEPLKEGRGQVQGSVHWQQAACGQLITRFPYFCRWQRDLCHFGISAVGQREPEVGMQAESVRQGTFASIFTFNLRSQLQVLDRVTHADPEVAGPPREHRPIVARRLKLAAHAVDALLNGSPRPVVNETMNRVAEGVGWLEQVLVATEHELRFADPTREREQQGYATSGWLLVSTGEVLMRPEHLAWSILQYGPPTETIEA
jgi:hypothetical protein